VVNHRTIATSVGPSCT